MNYLFFVFLLVFFIDKADANNKCLLTSINPNISQFSKLFNHFSQKSDIDCFKDIQLPYLLALSEYNGKESWTNHICYKKDKKQICETVFPKPQTNHLLSSDKIIIKALERLKLIKSKSECRVRNYTQYSMDTMASLIGCFIVYEEKKCTDSFCAINILINGKQIDQVDVINNLDQNVFFRHKRMKYKMSLHQILRQKLKLNELKVQSVNDLKKIPSLKLWSFSGIVCKEDLLELKSRGGLNECTPELFTSKKIINNKFVLELNSSNQEKLVTINNLIIYLKRFREINRFILWNAYVLHI